MKVSIEEQKLFMTLDSVLCNLPSLTRLREVDYGKDSKKQDRFHTN